MSSNSILNEHLMVRERLQEAYRKIIFISDHDFAQDPVYKKANQVLYARIKKLEENPEVERVRNVRDVIPSSNLARYGPYPYDEVRERAYTPSWWEPLISSSTICYHGPQQPAATVVESWTTPEVEQIFRHTIYAGSLNFNIYEAELEHLDKISVIEDMPLPSLVSACCGGEFRKFYNYNPVIEQLFERTTTKQLRNAKHPEAENYLPYYFNVKEYEDVLLRKKILADIVKELWNRPKLENYDKALKVYKTSLENVFVEEDNFKYVNCLRSNDTEKNLQVINEMNLVDSIVSLNEKLPKIEAKIVQIQPETMMVPPVRRLYSDVVQGNKSPTKQEAVSSPTKQDNNEQLKTVETLINIPEMDMKLNCNFEGSEAITAPTTSYSEVLNTPMTIQDSSSLFLHDSEDYDNEIRSSNGCNPLQVVSNTVYNTNYRMNYGNPYSNTTPVPTTRPTLTTCPQWFLPATYRSQNICGYGNFLGQLLLPQMPTKHKWTNFTRPTTPQTIFQNASQNWNLQSLYQTAQTSQQPVPNCSSFDPPKAKTKKTVPSPITTKFVKTKPDANKTIFIKKPSVQGGASSTTAAHKKQDYKLMTRQSEVVQEQEIPVACSASDDLEKIALREYQSSSNDMFFTEIERQAKEQYDGNPENSCCPPTKSCLCLGGRLLPYCSQHHMPLDRSQITTAAFHPARLPQMYLLYNTCYICLF